MATSTSTTTLNSGYTIPSLGLGTWEAREGECYAALIEAFKIGYRHIDTASAYENEEEIGRAIKDSGLDRSEIFITTKVPSIGLKEPEKWLEQSLKNLQTDYVDLLLMHWPVVMVANDTSYWRPVKHKDTEERNVDHKFDYKKVWELFELLPKEQVRSIGVCNFDTVQLQDLVNNCKITPAMNQVELHPYLPQYKLLEFCKQHNIANTAFCPMGQNFVPLRQDPTVIEVAEKNNITPAQVLMTWGIQRGAIVIPKSSNPERLAQNFKTLELTLSAKGMQTIDNIHKSKHVRTTIPKFDGIPMFQDDKEVGVCSL